MLKYSKVVTCCQYFSNFDDTLKSAPGFSIVSNYDNILEYECMHIIILESCLYGSGCKRKFHGD